MAESSSSSAAPELTTAQVATFTVISVAVASIAYLAWSGFYTVREFEKAVVLRWGKYIDTVEPGLHFKIPGVDKRILVDCSERTLRLPWGLEEHSQRGDAPPAQRMRNDDTLILTGDLYAAVVEWNLFWVVTDPEKFVLRLNQDEVNDTINAIARSTMHGVVGDYSADEILTGKREEIALKGLEGIRSQLAQFDCGIEVSDLQLQRAIPPDRVKPAFDEVNASIQQRDKLINEARRERNSLLPLANANSDKLVREAEGYASRRRAEASGEITALLAKFDAYQQAPELTRKRLYLETMERVLKNAGPKLIVDESFNGFVPWNTGK